MNKNKNGLVTSEAKSKIILYSDKRGNVELRADIEKETLWATQEQIARLFVVDRSVVTKHISNILRDKELDKDSVCAKFAHTAEDGKKYLTNFYNLDVVLAVGYRTNSASAIKFRIWATSILREYLVKGFNLNKRQLTKSEQNFDNIEEALAYMKSNVGGKPLKAKMAIRITKDLLP